MNKHSLSRFIDKYYLGGNCSSVIINSKGDKLSTRFITGDKNLLGELHMTGWNFDDADLGVYKHRAAYQTTFSSVREYIDGPNKSWR